MAISLTPSVFNGGGMEGDFLWMITRPEYADALFIYNDNEGQSDAFLAQVAAAAVDKTSPACMAGAGNGQIRPYQCDSPPRAAGVPTGPGYTTLTSHARGKIDAAIAYIATLLATGRYTNVIYSADEDDPDTLGSGTFVVGEDVLKYIPAELKRIVDAVNAR